jgi:H+-transporting ATPase
MSDPPNTVSEKEPGTPAPPAESSTTPQDEIKVEPAEKKKREYKEFGHDEEKATRTYL